MARNRQFSSVRNDYFHGSESAIQPIGAADRLEQVVIAQFVVQVDVRATWRIKAGQQLADDDQQLHVRRFVDEA